MEGFAAESDKMRFALLIDAENARPTLIDSVIDEVGKYGHIIIKRIYGDFTMPNMNSWKKVITDLAIQPVLQLHNVSGKNSSDFAMTIDAMDILYSKEIDAFCLVSSDSDFTRLVTRLRENGKFVMGVGKNGTSASLVNACNVFVFTEILEGTEKVTRTKIKSPKKESLKSAELNLILDRAYEMCEQEEGTARLPCIGISIRKINPGFDARAYGYTKLKGLFEALNDKFDLEQVNTEDNVPVYFVRRIRHENSLPGHSDQ